MIRYLRLFRRFIEQGFSYESHYRMSTFVNIATSMLWLLMMVVSLEILFANTDTIAGWTKPELLVLALFWGVVDEFSTMLWKANHNDFANTIISGDMDSLLVKPVNTFFLVNFRLFLTRAWWRFLVTIALFMIALIQFDLPVTILSSLLALVAFGSAAVTYFSYSLLLNTLAFWLGRIDNINSLIDTTVGMSRYPIDIFSRFFRILLLTVIPVGIIGYAPIAVFLNKHGALLALASCGIALLFFAFAYWFFHFALRRYSSASS